MWYAFDSRFWYAVNYNTKVKLNEIGYLKQTFSLLESGWYTVVLIGLEMCCWRNADISSVSE